MEFAYNSVNEETAIKDTPAPYSTPHGDLGNQDSDFLSPKSMDTLVNRIVSCSSEKK